MRKCVHENQDSQIDPAPEAKPVFVLVPHKIFMHPYYLEDVCVNVLKFRP